MKLLTLALSLVPGLALAQVTPQEMMRQGLYRIAQSEQVTVKTIGTEWRGGRNIEIAVSAAYSLNTAGTSVKLEVLTYEDGKLVARQAADGSMLWDFNARSNTYSSSAYSDSEGQLFSNWRQRLFHTLKLRTQGATAFTLRVLDDAFGTGLSSGTWSPWIPTSSIQRIEGIVYATSMSPNKNTTAYSFEGSDEVGFDFTGADYTQYFSNGNVDKHWITTIIKGSLPEATVFQFVPPKSAKAVAVDSRQGL